MRGNMEKPSKIRRKKKKKLSENGVIPAVVDLEKQPTGRESEKCPCPSPNHGEGTGLSGFQGKGDVCARGGPAKKEVPVSRGEKKHKWGDKTL